MRLTQNSVAGLICLALSIGMLVLTRGLPQSSFVPVGPDFYPRIVLVIMAVLSALLIVVDLWPQPAKGAEAPAVAAPAPEERNYRLVGVTYAVFTGYVILLPLVGYRVATFIFVAALQAVFESPRGVRRWALVMVSALATALITYIVFNDYLSVLLPRGHWTGW
ncbi:MAG TPA: tripartite tricarboxylate transporter TctB family protein [Burkholderiales bacterium]